MLKGVTFGLTSGIITTLGMVVGLNSGTGSRVVVLGGILTIAVSDAFSDALGIHISEESEGKHTVKEIWEATITTFISKLIFSLTFTLPVLLLRLNQAVIASIAWGITVLCIISYWMAKDQKESPLQVIGEHLLIAVVVIIITNLLGMWISQTFV